MTLKQLFQDPKERIYLLSLFVVFVLLSLIFSGIHSFFCLTVGFFWSYDLYWNEGPKDYMVLGKWKVSHGRYSFIKLIRNANQSLEDRFNPKHSPLKASILRLLPPSVLFILLNALPFSVEWYFVLLGGFVFETAYAFDKRHLLFSWIQKR
ncbi:MAG: hypothetical protein OXB88_10995 [Bacteriovoracales bacterium]|nr:hypothetical protein [Bacteriovoracales bacterium]